MTRTTSAESYRELRESGKLPGMQGKVLDYIRAAGPVSGRQISQMITGGWKRISELVRMGLVEKAREEIDIHTGKRVIFWQAADATRLLPGFSVKQPRHTRKQLEERIMWLENEVESLKQAGNKPERAALYFFSMAESKHPSPYFQTLQALLASPAYMRAVAAGYTQVWTGSHAAPIPVYLVE